MGKPINDLLFAIESCDNTELDSYLSTNDLDTIRKDFDDLIEDIKNQDLKAFTMAAMQGLLASSDNLAVINRLANNGGTSSTEAFGKTAVSFARATLAELQKQQS
ncbi:hypothetical protein F0L74_09900 [Chitinophaga agrisoli]|uniref:Uncharacterized protein n=1 Tax=Chitinophaga agrisoli TaxID=2607653 RepID=A0A5B2VWY6_9BACT|nr:hypothetical protein [Chitinophaga agrisoli]KAA2242832.1 hypothetical protein F0L74_09900 [Chitinophaga agrisoli]